MITEPLMMAIGHENCSICGDLDDDPGWELSCDNCGSRMDIDADPGDPATLERWARDDGWIVLMDWHYCCLDCLLRHRQSRLTRRAHVYVADLRRTEARP